MNTTKKTIEVKLEKLLNVPNKETKKAIKEARAGKNVEKITLNELKSN